MDFEKGKAHLTPQEVREAGLETPIDLTQESVRAIQTSIEYGRRELGEFQADRDDITHDDQTNILDTVFMLKKREEIARKIAEEVKVIEFVQSVDDYSATG